MVSVKFALVLRLAGVSGEGGAAAPRKKYIHYVWLES